MKRIRIKGIGAIPSILLIAVFMVSMVLAIIPTTPSQAFTNIFYSTSQVNEDGGAYNKDWDSYQGCHDGDGYGAIYNSLAVGQTFIDQTFPTQDFYSIRRSGFWVDTSAIPDDASITASLWIRTTGFTPPDNNFYVVLVDGKDMADSEFQLNNYQDLLDETTSWGSLYINGDITEYTWYEIPLNVEGISNINKTGITKIGLRSNRDINSQAPAFDESDIVSFSVQAGNRPYLEVTYPIGGIPSAPTNLMTDSQTTPRINNPNPVFSAIGGHEDAGEILTHAAVYMDDSPDFSSLIWNSYKTDITDFNKDTRGYITYNGTALMWNTRYFWAIKFWDSDDDEGYWSDASYFDYGVLGGGTYDEEGSHYLFDPYEGDIYDAEMSTGIFGWQLWVDASEAMGFTAKGSGDPPQVFMAIVVMILTVIFGFAVMQSSGSTWLGIIGAMLILGGGAAAGMMPAWIIIVMGITGFAGWYVFRHAGV